MWFNPKEAWQSVSVLSEEDKSNQTSPTIMRVQITNRELATTDAENASIFGPHAPRIFNNNRLIYWPVLEKIKQIYVMEEL